jgi:hypothetical protein
VVIGALALTLASALFHARRSARERDRSLALAERNAAVNVFVETLLTRTARAGPLTAVQMLERSERLIEKQLGDNPEHRAYVLGVLATCHHRMTNPARSVELLQRAVGIASGTTDRALLDSLTSRLAYSRALWAI